MGRSKYIGLLLICMLLQYKVFGQKKQKYELRTVAFYNLENLFDTLNDSLTFDDDRTPEGKDAWTMERYRSKLKNMARVISEIGTDLHLGPPDIIGVCEVENHGVLQDLINQPALQSTEYGIIHFDSPDERGIDVALLYKKAAFLPLNFSSHRLLLFNDQEERDYTRDQLIVEGLLDNEKFYFLVNHWPSRSGGELRSRPYRMGAAKLNQHIIDSVRRLDRNAKLIAMGDFNDDPTDPSLKIVLKVKGKKGQLDSLSFFGPMEQMFKKGIGSLAYRDQWNLFDQIYMTSNLVHPPKNEYVYWKANIFTPNYLLDPKGKYKGYPLRTYAGGAYIGGYSDHFPVYVHLIRKVGMD